MITKHIRQPLTEIPENRHLPAEIHELADRWRDLNDRTETAWENAITTGSTSIEAARAKDKAALRDAIQNDADLPAGNEHENAAKAEADTEERRFHALETELEQVGRNLLAQLRRHRSHIAAAGGRDYAAARQQMQQALAESARLLNAASDNLTNAAWLGVWLASADTDQSDIGGEMIINPREGFRETIATLNRADQWAMFYESSAAQREFEVVGSNGVPVRINATTALGMIDAGHAKLVNPSDREELIASAGGYASAPTSPGQLGIH